MDTIERLNNNISWGEDPICDSAHTSLVVWGCSGRWAHPQPLQWTCRVLTTGPPGTSPCSAFTAQTCASMYAFSDTCVYFLPTRLPSGWQCLEGRGQACPHLCCLSGLAVADAWECGRESWGTVVCGSWCVAVSLQGRPSGSSTFQAHEPPGERNISATFLSL